MCKRIFESGYFYYKGKAFLLKDNLIFVAKIEGMVGTLYAY